MLKEWFRWLVVGISNTAVAIFLVWGMATLLGGGGIAIEVHDGVYDIRETSVVTPEPQQLPKL